MGKSPTYVYIQSTGGAGIMNDLFHGTGRLEEILQGKSPISVRIPQVLQHGLVELPHVGSVHVCHPFPIPHVPKSWLKSIESFPSTSNPPPHHCAYPWIYCSHLLHSAPHCSCCLQQVIWNYQQCRRSRSRWTSPVDHSSLDCS